MSNKKEMLNLVKNPSRNEKIGYKKYIPQYQALGIDPEEVNFSSNTAPVVSASLPPSNPRAPRSFVRQPYASPTPSSLGQISLPNVGNYIPNVGNNVEHVWSSVDSQIIDDLNFDENQPMIDNNDYLTDEAFGISPKKSSHQNESLKENSFNHNLSDLHIKNDEYILMVYGQIIDISTFENIQEQVENLLFGKHQQFKDNVAEANILVLKKVPIKVGVFLDK